MSKISDKIAEMRGGGHHVSAGLEGVLLDIENRLEALEGGGKIDKPKAKPNPLDGERIDS